MADWAGLTSDDQGGDSAGDGRNAEVDFKGEKRRNLTHGTKTNPDVCLYKKAKFAEAKLRHLSHIIMENRHGLVVDVETTQAIGTAEREAAETMARRTLNPGSTLAEDKGYDMADHLQALKTMGIKPHTATKGSAVDGRTKRSKGYAISMVRRKRIEECFAGPRRLADFARRVSSAQPRFRPKPC